MADCHPELDSGSTAQNAFVACHSVDSGSVMLNLIQCRNDDCRSNNTHENKQRATKNQ